MTTTILDGLAPVFRAPSITPQPAPRQCANPFCEAGWVPPMHFVLVHDGPVHCIEGHDCKSCRSTGLPEWMLGGRS